MKKHTQQTQLTSQIQQMFEAVRSNTNPETVRIYVKKHQPKYAFSSPRR